ncbi:MAG: hypothetical protein R3C28_10820 [Pirellulaceae bacterium]
MIVRQNGEPHRIYTRDPSTPFMNASGQAACQFAIGRGSFL